MKRLPTRRLITEAFLERVPEFAPLPKSDWAYWFARQRPSGLWQFIVVGSSQKERCFNADVAITFFAFWNRGFGTHHMRAATGLPNIVQNSQVILASDTVFPHDGTVNGAQQALAKICGEIRAFALPWLDRKESEMTTNPLTIYGINWLRENLKRVPDDIETQLQPPLKNPWDEDLPAGQSLLEELKADLRRHAETVGASKWDRREISGLGLDLLTYASRELKKTSPFKGSTEILRQ